MLPSRLYPFSAKDAAFLVGLGYVVDWPPPTGAFQGQRNKSLKQIFKKGREAYQLAFYKRSWEVELGIIQNQLQQVDRAGLKPIR